MTLQGAPQLMARLEALGRVAEPLAHALGSETVRIAQQRVPVRTGRTRASIRLGQVTAKGAQIIGSAVAMILDRGAREHDEVPRNASVLRFTGRNGAGTIFAPQVHKPRQAGTHFLTSSADAAAHATKTGDVVIKAWNDAA